MSKRPIKQVIDFEAKAAEQRQNRMELCMKQVNTVLAQYKCDVIPEVLIGEVWVPLSMVLNFQSRIAIIPKKEV